MNEQVASAVGIARQFQFKPFNASAESFGTANQQHVISQCENHLDEDFMRLLASGAHLDFEKYPL